MADPAGTAEPTDAGTADALRHDRQLCFAVYAASRALTGLYRELLAEVGLTYPQYLVLLVLWERGTLSVKELGTALRLDSGTLSPLLRRMEEAGLVRRRREAADDRVVLVSATPEGAALRARVRGVPGRVLEATGMTAAEAAELRTALDRLTGSAGAAAAELRARRTADGPEPAGADR
ncbi:MarR family winged helix-turn-helix transcriptional regulator [Streptomonospora nanhaiensis]|uniref:MarR family winged helix-turn-helix transcriptional regulator n=1 Tax=Streptomonospora nanhaiensis TaxID=1323731 RepID=UPI001C39465A|nr:MarR family transcriptional regulator [Streptomonospora nanhaiensis]MBV2366314.1 MarR family transcriptional regulator [Streptomonospora nanhaiensis]MBX9387930.1 MarR family transcriptional regulator [Streptomonospora nanhaiensis]